MVNRNGGRNLTRASQAIRAEPARIAAAPVRAVLVPASAMVDARLADADPIGTYMSVKAPLSCW